MMSALSNTHSIIASYANAFSGAECMWNAQDNSNQSTLRFLGQIKIAPTHQKMYFPIVSNDNVTNEGTAEKSQITERQAKV